MMAERHGPIAVVGAGVSGLTTALCLLRRGLAVTMSFREPPQRTTSAVAPAIWHAYLAAPRDRVLEWSRTSFERFQRLCDDPATGVRMVEGVEARLSRQELVWGDVPPSLRTATPDQLPQDVPSGFVATVPLIDMRLYLDWLLAESLSLGLEMVERTVVSLDEVLAEHAIVINCSGLGARDLAGDDGVYPVRGQVVRVIAPEITSFLLDAKNPAGTTYVIPRTDCVVIGGTAEVGMTSLEPDPETRAAMLARATKLIPSLAGAPIVSEAAGLRPARAAVRVETERRGNGAVVHNYGHAGAGVTISWGCAEEVATLVADLLDRVPTR